MVAPGQRDYRARRAPLLRSRTRCNRRVLVRRTLSGRVAGRPPVTERRRVRPFDSHRNRSARAYIYTYLRVHVEL